MKATYIASPFASKKSPNSFFSDPQDLYAAGYFCFLITSEQLFPVSGPFWSNIYELPMWSNFFCGQEGWQITAIHHCNNGKSTIKYDGP